MGTSIEMAQMAKEIIVGLTGLKVDTISGISKDDKGWHVLVEVVEMRRIPESNDMLATYETLLNDGGELISYARTSRYRRDQVQEREG
jgi:hypothetical protein